MADVQALLARDPLRNIVLLKHLQAYPGHARLHHVADGERHGFLVLLDAAATSWDRRTYPDARFVVLVAGDGPDLTRALLDHVPFPRLQTQSHSPGTDRVGDLVADAFWCCHDVPPRCACPHRSRYRSRQTIRPTSPRRPM
jgi:hypothetical protein